MPFTVSDFHDLVQLLEQDPEWRADVRRLVLTDEVLALPQLLRELAAAQARTGARLEQLAAAQGRTEDQLLALIEAQGRTERRQDRTERELQRIRDDLGELKGNDLERAHRENPYAYFGQLIRRAYLLPREELRDLLDEAVARGQLGPEEATDVLLMDAVVRGRRESDGADVYLVVEVSWSVGPTDVERASRRAALLARAGLPTWPVAGGERARPRANVRPPPTLPWSAAANWWASPRRMDAPPRPEQSDRVHAGRAG